MMIYKEVEIQEKDLKNSNLGQIGSAFTMNTSGKPPTKSLTKSCPQNYVLDSRTQSADGLGRLSIVLELT